MTNFLDHPRRATIQLASAGNGEACRTIPCCFEGMVNKRLSLTAADRLHVSCPVTVEYEDAMFLGEVVACTQDCNETWRLEMKVEQVLTGLQSLLTLRQRLLGESVPSRVREKAAAI